MEGENKMREISRRNHVVPKFYLKRWGDSNFVWSYSFLVADQNIPKWKSVSIKKAAVIQNFYVKSEGISETDKLERWLNEEIETPVQEPIQKAINGIKLSPDEWSKLIRFTASMSLRTPARIVKNRDVIIKKMPTIMDNLNMKISSMSNYQLRQNIINNMNRKEEQPDLPIRAKKVGIDDNADKSIYEIKAHIGKSILLTSTLGMLENKWKILLKHRWKIIEIADGLSWPTSDDPVVCFNGTASEEFDFNGGWNKRGSQIVFPISPKKAIYTRVGGGVSLKGKLDKNNSIFIYELIIRHAFRNIYSETPNLDIERVRSRLVNKKMFEDEEQQWETFHSDHMNIESKFDTSD